MKPPTKKKVVRKVKAWAVVYCESGNIQERASSEYGICHDLPLMSIESQTAKADMELVCASMNARHKKGTKWKVVPVTITYSLPK